MSPDVVPSVTGAEQQIAPPESADDASTGAAAPDGSGAGALPGHEATSGSNGSA
ncbi:MAG: hypothetical protein JWO79_4041, partial [Actinomycetia bacterium]|nr:hypothetical protein [Actinomycetes bacterium]